MRTLSATLARRLAITRQHLAGPRLKPGSDGMLQLLRDLRCLQLDPTSAVAPSHLLVLWSRLGAYDPAPLEQLRWRERKLFDYWAHAMSIVLTEDYPIHQAMMRSFMKGDSVWDQRMRDWMEQNKALRRHILSELRRKGALPLRAMEDRSKADWPSSGWTAGRNVSRMVDFLWWSGRLMGAGREGGQRYWDLSERCLPADTPRERLSARAVTLRAVPLALRALGVATPKQIQWHFIRRRYAYLSDVLSELERRGEIERVHIPEWPGTWYLHGADVPLLERIAAGDWQPRTTLLSPFDNLICDRARTAQLFNFTYRIEIYTPKHKRQFGYYVLPVLHGDRLIGRIDPQMDRPGKRLIVKAIHWERGAPRTPGVMRAIRDAIEQLGTFLGAQQIAYGERVSRRPLHDGRTKVT